MLSVTEIQNVQFSTDRNDLNASIPRSSSPSPLKESNDTSSIAPTRDRQSRRLNMPPVSSKPTPTADDGTTAKLTLRADTRVENPYYYDYASYYRWVALVFFVLLSIVTGAAFFNWPPLRDILSRENAYSDLCHEGSSKYKKHENGLIECKEKDLAIAAVFPIATAVMFGFDLVAGIVLDLFGGKVCVMCGIVSQVIGWILLGLSTPRFNGYLAGICFIAAGVDPGFFGLLSISNLFPGWESTIVAVLGAARAISYGNFLLLELLLKSSPNITLMGVCIGFVFLVLIFAIMAFLFIPYQSYPKLPAGVPLYTELKSEDKIKYSQYLNEAPSFDLPSLKSKLATQFGGLRKYIMTVPYILFCLLTLIALIRNNYYSVSYRDHLPSVTTLYSILNPLSFIPCPFIGAITDRSSTVMTMIGLAVLAAVSMALVMFQGIGFEYLSLFTNFFFISFCISQFYCYIAYVYPQNEMGKLIGVSLLIGGLGSLVATPMYNFAVQKGQFLAMDLSVVLMEVLAIGICLFLYFHMERPVQRKNAEELMSRNVAGR